MQSTLIRRHRGETRSTEDKNINQQSLDPQQEAELIAYLIQLTKYLISATREMIQDFASTIAKKPVSESWVTRFIHRQDDHITLQWTTGMDSNRHKADLGDKYRLYFNLLYDIIEKYHVQPRHTYNMDEKGFMIGVVGRSRRIFSKRIWKKKGG